MYLPLSWVPCGCRAGQGCHHELWEQLAPPMDGWRPFSDLAWRHPRLGCQEICVAVLSGWALTRKRLAGNLVQRIPQLFLRSEP